jgi:hypothetical protein
VESPELEALVKATAALRKLETTEDVLNISTAKVDEILCFAENKSEELDAVKNANQANLLIAKNSALSSILSAQGEMSLAVAEKQNLLNAIVDNFSTLNDIPNSSTILTEISTNLAAKSFLKNGDLPFLFGILSRNDDYSTTGAGGFATTFSGPASANATHANGILNLLTGCHSYTTEYAGFYKPPTLCFLQGSAGNFIYRNLYTQYASTYTYAREAVGCIFIKNTTNAAITATLNFGGSGETTATYGGLGAMVGVPDLTNETMTWTSITYTTGTSGTNLSGSFSVPANSTVVLLICTTSYYITSYETCYFKFLHWNVRLFRSTTLVEGLEVDLDLTKRAWQCSGHSNVLDIFAEE